MPRIQVGVVRYASVANAIAKALGIEPAPECRIGRGRITLTLRRLGATRWAEARRLAAASTIVALTGIVGCRDATTPQGHPQLALLATADGDPLTVLDVRSGAVIERPTSGVGVFGEDARALSAHSPVLYYSGAGKLVRFDLTTRSIAWTEQLGGGQEARFGGQTIYANFAIAISPDESSLLVADSYNLGSVGVAVLDVSARNAIGFIDNIRIRKMFTIQPGELLPDGGVLALGTRSAQIVDDDAERRRGQFYFLSGTPTVIGDSVKFLTAADSVAGGVADMIVDAAGKYAYFTTFNRKLYKYDLPNRAYAGSINLPAYGPLALSQDGQSIYVIDATQTRDAPGSGFMYVADAALNAAETIDLNAAAREGLPPQLNSVVVGDGLVFVGAGTSSRGPLYGVQHGSVIAVDTRARTVKQILALPTWGVRSILPL